MKKVFAAFILIFVLALHVPNAYADGTSANAVQAQGHFETDATSAEDVQTLAAMGQAFQQYADTFGCYKFAWGHFSPKKNTITLEYIPDNGTTVENWTRLMTVTLNKMDADGKNGVAEDMARMVAGYLEVFNGKGHVISAQKFTDDKTKDAMLYIEYEIGEGAHMEHNIGILRRVSQDTAAFIQIQARGQAPYPSDAEHIKNLLPQNRTPAP